MADDEMDDGMDGWMMMMRVGRWWFGYGLD